MVFIEGRLQTRSWEDKNGVKRWTTEIVAENMQLGPRTAQKLTPREPIKGREEPAEESEEPVEEIPVIEEEPEEINIKDIPF